MNLKVFIVNGEPGAGKTTFETEVNKFCEQRYENCYVYLESTINPVKKIASRIGWHGEKTPQARKFLSDLKDLLTNFNDYPFKAVTKRIEEIEADFLLPGYFYDKDKANVSIFIDCREPKEIEKLVNYCKEAKIYVKTLLIKTDDAKISKWQSNHADSEVFNYNYDIEILNDCRDDNMLKLRQEVERFVYEFILKEEIKND